MAKESKFQKKLKEDLEEMLPGCIIAKLDPSDIQGIPDLLILFKNKWATLENKKYKNAIHQPNQDYYVDLMNEMSYSNFIYPENRDLVLSDLKNFFLNN